MPESTRAQFWRTVYDTTGEFGHPPAGFFHVVYPWRRNDWISVPKNQAKSSPPFCEREKAHKPIPPPESLRNRIYDRVKHPQSASWSG